MNKFAAFFKSNVAEAKNVEIKLDRFNEPFVIKPLTDDENEKVKKECSKMNKKTKVVEIDNDKYLKELIAQSVIVPDFKDAELQADWGVIGADNLIRKMFLAGESMSLAIAVQDAAGFDTENTAKEIDEAIKEAKN